MKKKEHLEGSIRLLQRHAKAGPLTIQKILDILSGHGRYFILILLSLPFCQPLQIPGLSTPFGLVIAFLGIRSAFAKKIWLPQKILSKKIPSHTLINLSKKFLWALTKIDRFIHPRLSVLCHGKGMRIVNGLLIALLGIFLALPLPIPFSNLLAAWAIFLLGLGLAEEDGVLIICGYLVSVLTFGILVAMGVSIKMLFSRN